MRTHGAIDRPSARACLLAVALLAACGSSPSHGGAGGSGGSGGAAGSGGTGGAAGSGGSGGSGGLATGGSGAEDAAAQGGTGGATSEDAAAADAPPAADAGSNVDAAPAPADAAPPATGDLTLTSSAFKQDGTIDPMYRCPPNGNVSPPLSWTPGPAGTKSYAVALQHTATSVHWQIWDIPADTTSLPMDVAKVAMPPVPAGSVQNATGIMNTTSTGYFGPCPTSAMVSMYTFTVWALSVDKLPGLSPQSTVAAVTAALDKYKLKASTLIGDAHD